MKPTKNQNEMYGKLLYVVNYKRVKGVQIFAVNENRVIPSEYGGTAYQYNVDILWKRIIIRRTLRIHIISDGAIILELINCEKYQELLRTPGIKSKIEIEKEKAIEWRLNFSGTDENSPIKELADFFSDDLKKLVAAKNAMWQQL
jgi:hypothetical protein